MRVWLFVPEGSRTVGHPKKRWVDELSDFAERCQGARKRKRLKFMLRHIGESTKGGEDKYDTQTWRAWWKKCEEAFVSAV